MLLAASCLKLRVRQKTMKLIPETDAARDLAERYCEQKAAARKVLGKIRLPLIPEASAARDLAKRWREQEAAMRPASARIRRLLIPEVDAARDSAKRWREQEAAMRPASARIRRLLIPEVDAARDSAKRWREQEAAMRQASARIRRSLIPEVDAARDSAKRWREQEAAMRQASAKIRRLLTMETDAVRDLAERWREQEAAIRQASAKIRRLLTLETDAVRDLAKKCREQAAVTQHALKGQQLPPDSLTMPLKSSLEKSRIQDMQAWQSYGPVRRRAMRSYLQKVGAANRAERKNQDALMIFDDQNVSPDFISLHQSDDMEFTVRLGDQQFSMNVQKETACDVYVKGNILCLIGIVREHLCSFVEKAMYESVGCDWEKRLPRKARDRCEQDRSRYASSTSTPNSLLAYATFKDLSDLICFDVNWDQIFQRIFLEREPIKGSLFWINKIRNSAAHGPSVSKDEQQRLFVEAKYILDAIKNRKMI